MPLTEKNYIQFYLGTGAEFHLMSQVFLLGFEAYKLNPDIGLDILITNKARQQFRAENSRKQYLQVKSTFARKQEATFFIKVSEIEFLLSDESVALVLCVFEPLIEADPKSLKADYSDTSFYETEEANLAKILYEQQFHKIKQEGNMDSLGFKALPLKYFWLNNAQVKRALNDKIFGVAKIKDEDFYKLQIKLGDQSEISIVATNADNEALCPEVQNVYFLLNDCYCQDRLEQGAFLLSHYS